MRIASKWKVLLLLAITVAATSTALVLANISAAPPLPSEFFGTVKVDGQKVAAGTVVEGLIDGTIVAGSTTTFDFEGTSVYILLVGGDDPDTTTQKEGGVAGDTVQFKVGGKLANETGTWASGGSVTLNLTAASVTNTPPVANDQTVDATSGTSVSIQLTGSDPDAPTVFSFTITSLPGNGDLFQGGVKIITVPKTLNGENTVSYTSNTGFTGADAFNFKLNDGTVDSNIATVTINVIAPTNAVPVAFDATVGTTMDTPVSIHLGATDADAGDVLSFTVTSLPVSGELFEGVTKIITVPKTLTGDTVSYTPNTGFSGADAFQFKVNDGKVDSAVATVSINVSPAGQQKHTVSGTVLLEGVAPNFTGARVSFSAGGVPTQVFTDPKDSKCQVDLLPGTYTVTVEKEGFLPATKTGLVIDHHMTLPAVRLLGGDVNGDGVVEIQDLAIPSKNLGKSESPWP